MNLDVDIKRKATVRISRKDLQKLLAENEEMAEQIVALRAELDELRREHLPAKPKPAVEKKPYDPDDDGTFPDYNPPVNEIDPIFNPNIYLDGANGLGRGGPRFGSND